MKYLAVLLLVPIQLFSATVTNTNDSGPGSLREAAEAGGDINIEAHRNLEL